MKQGTIFTPCGDCIFYVGGECAEGHGKTNEKDGCEESYFYDCTLTELEKQPKATKKFIKYGQRALV